jgi:hypothetical protein
MSKITDQFMSETYSDCFIICTLYKKNVTLILLCDTYF